MNAKTKPIKEIIPAHLGFLAIYNPSLGLTDESIENQIVYYTSSNSKHYGKRRSSKKQAQDTESLRKQKDEQLRQVGFAQGIVEFGKNFSQGKSVKTIDTEKSRIVLSEFEPNWWILASINLTILPRVHNTETHLSEELKLVEYSSRNVKPAEILLADLLRAQSIFLLHHTSSINELFMRTKRCNFLNLLCRYWDVFSSRWNVLMHGNPTNNLYPGIKIASCGELGIGVGEEHRGSAERDILEGFSDRVEGIVDVIVSKFGEDKVQETVDDIYFEENEEGFRRASIGQGNEPSEDDGVVFLGTGALTRSSLRDLYYWIEDLYQWGIYAYGVTDNPKSSHWLKKLRKENNSRTQQTPSKQNKIETELIEPGKEGSNKRLNNKHSSAQTPGTPYLTVQRSFESNELKEQYRKNPPHSQISFVHTSSNEDTSKNNNLLNYFRLGYDKYWPVSINWSRSEEENKTNDINSKLIDLNLAVPNDVSTASGSVSNKIHYPKGRFLIGLQGDMEEYIRTDKVPPCKDKKIDHEARILNSKIIQRELVLELEKEKNLTNVAKIQILSKDSHCRQDVPNKSVKTKDLKNTRSLHVVVYTARPFIFVFLCKPDKAMLSTIDFYLTLHEQIQPIINPLINSTKYKAIKPDVLRTSSSGNPIFDLIWDPKNLTLSSSIPNIPDISKIHVSPENLPWSGAEALNTHMQMIKAHIAGKDFSELERICKTNRGWWIVWIKVIEPVFDRNRQINVSINDKFPSAAEDPTEDTPFLTFGEENSLHETNTLASNKVSSEYSGPVQELSKSDHEDWQSNKEIILIRRSNDLTVHSMSMNQRISNVSSITKSERGEWKYGVNYLAKDIGIDTRRYIEGLLNLNSQLGS